MGLNLNEAYGQTSLEEEKKEGLIIRSIATKEELDEFEQQNIEEAIQWTIGKPMKAETILTEKFVKTLHKKMFGDVWRWAGEFRKTEKNLGINKWEIPPALKVLCDDTLFWISNDSFSSDEIAMRFKHRIVSIHCFPNGNGRHSRLMADLIIEKVFQRPLFSWGTREAISENARSVYLNAVKLADKNDYCRLIEFARS
jgi:Fic-DOC domain mobile mystery protein B